MANTKPASKEKFINYPGKQYEFFRTRKVPLDISSVIPYFKDLATQVFEDYQHKEDIIQAAFDKLCLEVQANAKREIDLEEATEIIEKLSMNDPDLVRTVLQNMVNDQYNADMQYYWISSENRTIWNLGIQERGMYFAGTPKPKKIYYSQLRSEVKGMLTVTKNKANVIRFVGPPGSGKTVGVTRAAEEAALMGYYVYSNIPLKQRPNKQVYLNAYTISSISDMFIDSPDIPSILRVRALAEQLHRVIGAYFLRDEKARGMERYAQSKEVNAEASALQIRRHMFMGYLGAGAMDDVGEVKDAQTHQILVKSTSTGKWSKGEEVKDYSWLVRTKRDDDSEFHDEVRIYGPPEPYFLRFNFPNVYEMPNPVIADMLIDTLFDEIDAGTLNNEQMIEAGHEAAIQGKEWFAQFIGARKAKVETERDKHLNPRIAFCYVDDLFFVTRQEGDHPSCPQCKGRNTTPDASHVLAVIKMQNESEDVNSETVEQQIASWGKKRQVEIGSKS